MNIIIRMRSKDLMKTGVLLGTPALAFRNRFGVVMMNFKLPLINALDVTISFSS